MSASAQNEAARAILVVVLGSLERSGAAEAPALRTALDMLQANAGACVACEKRRADNAKSQSDSRARKAAKAALSADKSADAGAGRAPPVSTRSPDSHVTSGPLSADKSADRSPSGLPLSDSQPPASADEIQEEEEEGEGPAACADTSADSARGRVSRETLVLLVEALDPFGGATLRSDDHELLTDLVPGLERIAAARGSTPVEVVRQARARFRADYDVKRKRLGDRLDVFLTQLPQWLEADDGRAELLAELGKVYEAVCHGGKSTLTPQEVHDFIAPRVEALRARRSDDPVGLLREVVERWQAGLKRRGLAPKPEWFARDFAAVVDAMPESPRRYPLAPPTAALVTADPQATSEGLALVRGVLERRGLAKTRPAPPGAEEGAAE